MIRLLLRPSIARRMLMAMLLAGCLVWGVGYFKGLSQTQADGSGDFDRDMRVLSNTVVAVVGHAATPALLEEGLLALDTMLAGMWDQAFVVNEYMAFHVWDAKGTPVRRSRFASPQHTPSLQRTGFYEPAEAAVPIRVYGVWTPDARYRVEVVQTLASRRAQYDSVMLSATSFQMLLIGLLVVGIPALLMVHTGLKPLRQLSRELAQRRPDDLSPICVPHLYAELEPVVLSLNQKLAQLQDLLARERTFLADAAHELRTPLAVMTAQLDSLRLAGDHAERGEALARLQMGMARANRLVHQLLALARLDADAELLLQTVDAADLARDVLAQCSPEAQGRNVTLAYAGPEHLNVRVPGVSLEVILANLIRNAIRYGAAGGHIEVKLSAAGDEVSLTVLDDGPGVPVADRHRLFDRFHRGAGAAGDGSGLGLAIVAAATRQLGGTVHLHDGLAGRGFGVTVNWAPSRT